MYEEEDYDMESLAMRPSERNKKEAMTPSEKKAKQKRKMAEMMETFEYFASKVAKCKMGTAKDKAPIMSAVDTIRTHLADLYGK